MDSEQHYLTPLFEPRSIAIIGASERQGSIGATLARNMLDTRYEGKLFFVNPKHSRVYGQPCHDSVESLPQRLDLAVICTSTRTITAVAEACGRAGARCAIIVTELIGESAVRTATLERKLQEIARRYHMRLLGPDCLGIMRPAHGVNLSHAHVSAHPGSIGLIAQSGALCTAFLDWAQPNNVGFSAVATLGTSSDIDFGEVLDYLVADTRTKSILLYIEGIKNARRFMSALRAAARCKPVLLIKVGRHPAGELAALSHIGAQPGDDDVFDAALRRAGVVRLYTIGQMYATAQALLAHFRPRGNRLAIITNGGGPGVMAADHADAIGIPLAQLTAHTLTQIETVVPAGWSRGNPVDIGGAADPHRYAVALKACQDDENVDGILTLLTPQALTDPTQTARAIIELAHKSDKPIVTCWMGEQQVTEARLLFKGAGIPTFRTPEPAVDLFSHISNFFRNQQLLMQTPAAVSNQENHTPPRLESARLVIETALQEGRRTLSEMESKALLAAFQIPIAQTMVARSPSEAMVLAEEIGLPVAMKIDATLPGNKSDCGGVRLNLANLAAVRDAYQEILAAVRSTHPDTRINGVAIEPMIVKPNGRELSIGVIQDGIFGPTITLQPSGPGELGCGKRAVALPPLNRYLIHDMLESSSAAAYLNGSLGAYRSLPPANRAAIETVLLRVSEMACELPWIRTLEINPLIVDEQGAVAADARIVIGNTPIMAGRYDHMAIHPYPAQLVTSFQTADGQLVTIRPIRPEDAQMEQRFVQGLSSETRYFRFMNSIRELSPAQLIRLTQIDYDREMAFVATLPQDGHEEEIGVARYAINPDGESCEFAIVVGDAWQGKGLARRLMGVLIAAAKNHVGLKTMTGEFLTENQRMLKFVSSLGFILSPHPEDAGLKHGVLALN